MEPIILTQFGEKLLEDQKISSLESRHTTDEEKLHLCVGKHDVCTGWIDQRQISDTHQCICCRRCGLRIVFPIEVDTYGKLRQWCASRLETNKRQTEEIRQLQDEHAVYGECSSPEDLRGAVDAAEAAKELAKR